MLVVGLTLAGCSATSSSATGPPAPPGTATAKIHVRMHEWGIMLSARKAPAGTVTFTVHNAGLLDHELLVIATTRRASQLPRIGRLVNEPAAGTSVGQIEDISPGQTRTLTLRLKKGHYALICDDPGPPPHYTSGMHTDFWVVSGARHKPSG